MLRTFKTSLLAVVIVAGIWALLNRDKIQNPTDIASVIRTQWQQLWPASADAPLTSQMSSVQASVGSSPFQLAGSRQPTSAATRLPIAQNGQPIIRIASFKLNGFGTSRNSTRHLPILTDICKRYDAIALQGVDGSDDAWLNLLAESLNKVGTSFDFYFISDMANSQDKQTQSAILFNRATLELDHLHWYTVNDPDDLLRREPLVGWFRTRTPNPDDAFTFTLANIELNSSRPDLELAYLADLYRAIRDDGRGEDDVIVAGDFNSGDRGLEPIHKRAGLTWVISNTPTDVRNKTQYDNLVFSEQATIEFTGRGGVFDFMRKYNLTLEEAESLSSRMPVWAAFSIYEGTVGARR
jgi:hypothetical protein